MADRPTWTALQAQSPALCEAVVGWIRLQPYGYALGILLRGAYIDGGQLPGRDDPTGPHREWQTFCDQRASTPRGRVLIDTVRLRAAEYRMEAVAACRAEAAERDATLADALDAAADEAERLAGATP